MNLERRKKIESSCKKILSNFLIEESANFETHHSIITVTQVKLSQDSSYLDVYVSCLYEQDALTKTLAGSAHAMTRVLGKELKIMKIPKIRFRYDDSGEISMNIHSQIQNLSRSYEEN